MKSVVYIESIYKNDISSKLNKDTLSGSAFLVEEDNKIYLITAKHLIQSVLLGKNQTQINDSIYITGSTKKTGRGLPLIGIANNKDAKSQLILSSDDLDIAIISLNGIAQSNLLSTLLKFGSKPLPVDLINKESKHQVGDDVSFCFYLTYNSNNTRLRSKGFRPGKITNYPTKVDFFSLTNFFDQANNGAPIFAGGKVVGMLINERGINSNSDIINQPFKTDSVAKAVKATSIFKLLKKLYAQESTSH